MNNDVFETMPVPKAYFKMALPVVFGMVISLVYNMVDTWFITKTAKPKDSDSSSGGSD